MQRNASLEVLKLSLAIMIIGIHTGIFMDVSKYLYFLIVNGLFRVAVPVFFIINGFYLYGYLAKNKAFMTWIKRLIFLYLVWMGLYFPIYLPKTDIYLFLKSHDINSFSQYNWLVFLENIVIGFYQLWYLTSTACAGIILYTLRKRSDFEILALSFFMFLVGVVIQYFSVYVVFENKMLNILMTPVWSFRNFVFFGFPMLSIGYVFAKNDLDKIKINIKLLKSIVILGVVLLIFESSINFIYMPPTKKSFDMFLSLIFLSPALFLLAVRGRATINTDFLSKLSIGMFLNHVFFLFVLTKFLSFERGTLLFFIVLSLSVIVSCFLVKIDKKLGFIL